MDKSIKFLIFGSFLVLTAFLLSCGGGSDEVTLRTGVSEEPRTLNVWLASDANTRKVLSLIYQPLYTLDPDTLELAPWLAESMPEYNPEDLSYTVKLRPAKWSDGSDVTADDVVYTVDLIRRFKVPRYYSLWEFVDKAVAVDDRTVKFYLEEPKAIFLTRTMTTYIVSRKEWEPLVKKIEAAEKPTAALMNIQVDNPLGCGPFVLEQWKEGAYLYLSRNQHFFGRDQEINGRVLGPHVDSILFKIYGTADVAILALKKGNIDYLWWAVPPGYLKDLRRDENIQVFVNQKSGLYYMGFNVRKEPFSDPVLRRAANILIDKDFIVERVLQGYASRMDSIIPAENSYWYNEDVPSYGRKMSREERIKAAYELLKEGGYSWEVPPVNSSGKIVEPSAISLPDGSRMENFTILTPPADYDPNRATCGVIIQEWLKELGIPAAARPMSFGALLEKIKAERDFDTFVLGYGRLSLDPDYLRNFFHSENDKAGGWNMSGYRNPEFDRLAEASASEMESARRQELIYRMQEVVMEDVPYIPLYNPAVIEAVRKGDFSGWEEMVEGIGNLWSICRVRPEER